MEHNTLKGMKEIREVNASFPYTGPIKNAKKEGKKIIGWLTTYCPEEIIHAAGAVPYRVTGDVKEIALEEANAYMGVPTCSYARTTLQLAINKKFDFLDGLAGVSICESTRHMIEVWERYLDIPMIYSVAVPHKINERVHKFFREELETLKQKIEAFMGVQISDEQLIESISLVNRTRSLLRDLYELRKSPEPPITGAEVLEIVNASGRMPKEEFNPILENILDEVKNTKRTIPHKKRLMLSGCILNNPAFIESIEDLGGLIVIDEISSGIKYFADLVENNPDTEPMEALTRRYLNKFPCARMNPFDLRMGRILQLVKDFNIDGVITRVIRYCKVYVQEQYLLKQHLEKEGIPILDLDVEYSMPTTGQIMTRVQAFLEMLD